jgi:hypothetical protein
MTLIMSLLYVGEFDDLTFGWVIGWDARCPGLTTTIERKRHLDDETGHWEWTPEDGNNGWGKPNQSLTWKASNEKLFDTFYAMYRGWPNHIWPRVEEEGDEVPIEVCSVVEDSVEQRSTCRFCLVQTNLFAYLISSL